jgi:hypothetical protein
MTLVERGNRARRPGASREIGEKEEEREKIADA